MSRSVSPGLILGTASGIEILVLSPLLQGASLLADSAVAWCLADAAKKLHLKSDTYLRLNLALFASFTALLTVRSFSPLLPPAERVATAAAVAFVTLLSGWGYVQVSWPALNPSTT